MKEAAGREELPPICPVYTAEGVNVVPTGSITSWTHSPEQLKRLREFAESRGLKVLEQGEGGKGRTRLGVTKQSEFKDVFKAINAMSKEGFEAAPNLSREIQKFE